MKLILNMVGGPNWVGGQLYVQSLAKCIRAAADQDRRGVDLRLLVPESDAPKYASDGMPLRVSGRGWRLIRLLCAALGTALPSRAWRHVQNTSCFFYPSTDGRLLPYAAGAWIPDFQHVHMPKLFGPEEIANRNRAFRRMADCSPLVFVSSDMARQDFVRLYPEAAAKVRVLKFASVLDEAVLSGDPAAVASQYELPERFFLVCNQFWEHKDHTVVIDALNALKKRGINPVVACTGAMHDYRNPQYPQQILERIASSGLENQVKILGFIPRNDQLQLMRRCIAVIQPSRFEGWSTVVEDARTLGKSAILSDFPVHVEQAPPGAVYFQLGNAEALSKCLEHAWERLPAGPDLVRERTAFDGTLLRMQVIGHEFVKAVAQVITPP